MDAYSQYILRTSEARLSELRREAAEHAQSRAARRGRVAWWKRGWRMRHLVPARQPEVTAGPGWDADALAELERLVADQASASSSNPSSR